MVRVSAMDKVCRESRCIMCVLCAIWFICRIPRQQARTILEFEDLFPNGGQILIVTALRISIWYGSDLSIVVLTVAYHIPDTSLLGY